MALRLYDTFSRQKVDFNPIDPKNVRMYVCGPTVYDFAHIGNARPVIVFDVLFRLLRHIYGPEAVTYARNITDVDDKINARAHERGVSIRELTDGTLAQFHADVDALGCLRPTQEPRATDHMDEMRALIDRLVKRGVAYVAEDHVLFSVKAMETLPNAPRYGSLARRSLDEMLAGARVDVAPYKRDPMDFVLWKPSREPHEPKWQSPAGIEVKGRPGWHIECSAMSMAKLLVPFGGGLSCDDPQKNMFDIHGGGIDLVFPHHENEVAQSCCAFGTKQMANVWMHNGFLQVEGQKMSKSLGNFVTIRELLEGWTNFRWRGDTMRLAMLSTHYRQPIDWTRERLLQSLQILDHWSKIAEGMSPFIKGNEDLVAHFQADVSSKRLVEVLGDDLNTPGAISHIHALAKQAGDPSPRAMVQIHLDLAHLGINLERHQIESIQAFHGDQLPDRTAIEPLLLARNAARAAKNWAESDRIRDELLGMGIVLQDNKDGTTTWEVKR